jgi:hypothetical protein
MEDIESTPPSYKIVTYPADYTLDVIVPKFNKTILIPKFQRKYVWSQKQASRLIESFLLGLPVPAIFLYKDADELLHVIDGHQRLRSIIDFWRGEFGDEVRGRKTTFRLIGLHEKSAYLGKTYQDIKTTDPSAFNRLSGAVLRSFVVQQLDPRDNSGIYHIFERLNTGGTLLIGQEIRNCIYEGTFNDMLLRLNKFNKWRQIFGKPSSDARFRDVELILRFFALLHDSKKYKKPMKQFLNDYMEKHRKSDESEQASFSDSFEKTAAAVCETLGPKPFHIRAGLNAAIFDSVFVAFGKNLKKVSPAVGKRFRQQLLRNTKYMTAISASTTDEETIEFRLKEAQAILFG